MRTAESIILVMILDGAMEDSALLIAYAIILSALGISGSIFLHAGVVSGKTYLEKAGVFILVVNGVALSILILVL